MQESFAPPNNNRSDNHGIHIQDALSILSSRAKTGGEKNDLLQVADANPELKQLGQTLDLMNSQQWTRFGKEECCDPISSGGIVSEENSQEELQLDKNSSDNEKETANNHKMKLLQELSTQSLSELVSKLFQLQQARVSNYKNYNAGLEAILQSGNLSSYPSLTSGVTAAFAVISSSIKDIQSIFESKMNGGNDAVVKNISGCIQELQKLEKEKLSLTAALHLEKIRERNEFLRLATTNEQEQEESDSHRILQLLRQGVNTLQQQIVDCVEKINDVLEELRYARLEL
jgi:hypothetical protein